MSIKNIFSKIKFFMKANSPDILLGVGIVGTVAGTIIACVATSKVPEKKKEFESRVEDIHESVKDNEIVPDNELKKALTKEYVRFGFDLVKLYAPAVIIEGLSIYSIFGSSRILKKRSAIAMAAYATLKRSYDEYRKRVADKFGEDAEKEIRYSIKKDDSVVNEDGEPVKVVDKKDLYTHSPYAMIFDETNQAWVKDPTGRKFFLLSVQNQLNNQLQTNGYLFLNDVYKALGFPETKAGQIVGWLYRPDDPTYHGDGFVDFGMYTGASQLKRDFINGYEPAIILDFNVDGDILNLTNTLRDTRTIISKYMPDYNE